MTKFDVESTPYTSTFGILAPRITGSISAISSSLIIFVILRSRQKLSTIYHRIMFIMSCADVVASIAMALGTLPMPKEVPPEFLHFHYFETPGVRLGNFATCEAQGFLWLSGIFTMFCYNLSLSVYYALSLAFGMKDKIIRRYVEPIFHLFALTVVLVPGIQLLISDDFNPTDWGGWCTVMHMCANSYDYNESAETPLCYRGSTEQSSTTSVVLVTSISSFLVIIIVSLLLVFLKVYFTERQLAEGARQYAAIFQHHDQAQAALNRLKDQHKMTKVIGIQAVAYIGALFITLLFPFLSVMGNMGLLGHPGGTYSNSKEAEVLERLLMVFTPLQGFFNLCIFLGHKVYNYRRVHGTKVKRITVIKMLFTKSMDEPVMISRFSIVEDTAEAGQNAHVRGLRIQVEDEMDNEVSYFIVRRLGEYVDMEEGDASGSRLSLSTNSVVLPGIGLSINDEKSIDGLSHIELKSAKYLSTKHTRKRDDGESPHFVPGDGKHRYTDENIEDPQQDESSMEVLSFPTMKAQDHSGGNDVLIDRSSRNRSSVNLSGFGSKKGASTNLSDISGKSTKKSSRGYLFFKRKKETIDMPSANDISSLNGISFASDAGDKFDESLLSFAPQHSVATEQDVSQGRKSSTSRRSEKEEVSFVDSKDLSGFVDTSSQRLTSPAKSRRKQLSLDENSKDFRGFNHSGTSPQSRKKEVSFVDSKDLSGFDISSQPTTSRRSESRQVSRVDDSKDLSGFDVDSQPAVSRGSRKKEVSFVDSKDLSGFDISSQPTTNRRSESRQASRVDDSKDLSGFDVDSQPAASQLSMSNQEPQGEMRESSGASFLSWIIQSPRKKM